MKPTELNNLKWIEELLPDDIIPEPMHEGIGYYLDEKLVLILIEKNKSRIHRGITYPFEVWNGCFFPIQKIKQNAVIKNFLFLENHPALPNCLYIPTEHEDFEDEVKQVLREVKKRNPLFGIFSSISKPKRKGKGDFSEPAATNKPRMFGAEDETPVPPTQAPKKKNAKLKKIKPSKKDENKFLLEKLKKK